MGAYQDLDSEDLLGLVVIGRTEALEEIYDRYSRPVYSLVLGLLREPAIAEEVTQEVFLRVWLRSSSFKPLSGKAKTWILSIAHHRAIDRLRQQRHRQKDRLDVHPAHATPMDTPWRTGGDVGRQENHQNGYARRPDAEVAEQLEELSHQLERHDASWMKTRRDFVEQNQRRQKHQRIQRQRQHAPRRRRCGGRSARW